MKKLLDTLEEKSSALRTFDRPFSGLLLITGANGFVGQALCHEAIRRGMQIRGATRTICQLPTRVEPVVTGSIDESTSMTTY